MCVVLTFSVFVVCCAVGCGRESTAKYIPSSTVAREALQTALTTWQSGTAHGTIESTQPAINVFDLRWQGGQKLESFQIVEEITGQEQPAFGVKIKLNNKPEETNTYLVVGIDPLLIFRDIDYKKATGQ